MQGVHLQNDSKSGGDLVTTLTTENSIFIRA